jgi:hypothetical protein
VQDNERNVGAVWQELECQNIANDTPVLLSSDHGFFLGEHHLYDKRLMYEPSVRVPMMVRCPGQVKVRPCHGVRTDRYKLIHFLIEPQEWELYDLITDPDEMNNLYGKPEFEELTAHLKERLAALRSETHDTYEYQPTGIPGHWELGAQTGSGLTKHQSSSNFSTVAAASKLQIVPPRFSIPSVPQSLSPSVPQSLSPSVPQSLP